MVGAVEVAILVNMQYIPVQLTIVLKLCYAAPILACVDNIKRSDELSASNMLIKIWNHIVQYMIHHYTHIHVYKFIKLYLIAGSLLSV